MSDTTVDRMTVNGVEYVRADNVKEEPAEQYDGMDYVIIRTESAGVFAGYLEDREGKEVVLVNARRIWYWSGAATLSQLATDGTSDARSCKFPAPVPRVTLTEAIEIIPCSEKARKSIQGVKEWRV